jgi:factor associated with neutral sphingomyelinase activation
MLLHQIALRSHSAPAVGSILEVDPRWQTRVMRAWQTGLITNYDYLIYLNLAAGRSFNDLTQWPVLPWVLADYTSQTLDLQNPQTFRDLAKPIGALNPARLEMVRERCRQMPPGEKFLYGTHYSTPGYVLV